MSVQANRRSCDTNLDVSATTLDLLENTKHVDVRPPSPLTMRIILLWNILYLTALVPHHTLAAVLAIDYGTDWIKASLMKPGVPFDVLLNKDSKRKIQSAVGWKRRERLFGSDAANLVRESTCRRII